MTNIARHKKLLYILLIFIVYNSFFINKAFHIDDPFTISITRAVSQNSFIPVDFYHPRVTNGYFFGNPPFLGYFYLPFIKLFGEKEIVFHIASLPFSLLAIIAMYCLSLRFVRKGSRILPVLFLISTPAFIIMSQSIMLDIPELALMLSAIASFIYGIDRNDRKLLFIAGILSTSAILVKYSGVLIIPIMVIYILFFARKRFLLFLLIPLTVLIVWIIYNMPFYKNLIFIPLLLKRIEMLSFDVVLTRFFACLSFVSGTALINLLLIPFILYNRKNKLLLLGSLPVGFCPFIFKKIFIEYTFIEKFFLAFLFVSSIFLLLVIFKKGTFSSPNKIGNKDKLFLGLWLLIVLVFNVLLQFVSARFILFLFPPMFLIISNELSIHNSYFSLNSKKIVPLLVSVTVLFSTFLAIGDYHFADTYRDFVKNLKKEIPSKKKKYVSPPSYSACYTWGYAYYLNRYYPISFDANAWQRNNIDRRDLFLALPNEPVLPIVLKGMNDFTRFDSPDFKRILVKERTYESNVFLHNRRYRVGFYSHDWGMLPFKLFIRKRISEKFSIYVFVSRDVPAAF